MEQEVFQELKQAHAAVVDEFLDPETKLPNVVGLGVGVRFVGGDPERGIIGQPTGEPVLQVLVTRKLPREALAEDDLIPRELAGKPTDVIQSGRLTILQLPPRFSLTQRFRPARGGCSISPWTNNPNQDGVGTIATAVWSSRGSAGPGGARAPFLLSNNHVLANVNDNPTYTPIVQPGRGDGGRDPADRIAELWTFEEIDLFPPTPLNQHENTIDAAIATVGFGALDRDIYWSGYVEGYTDANFHLMGRQVKKTGRTSGFTTGTIIGINQTADVRYTGAGTARFQQVIITTPMAAPGDSGSLLTTWDNIAVGLLFGGGTDMTLYNPIIEVQDILRVQVAETFVPGPPPP